MAEPEGRSSKPCQALRGGAAPVQHAQKNLRDLQTPSPAAQHSPGPTLCPSPAASLSPLRSSSTAPPGQHKEVAARELAALSEGVD